MKQSLKKQQNGRYQLAQMSPNRQQTFQNQLNSIQKLKSLQQLHQKLINQDYLSSRKQLYSPSKVQRERRTYNYESKSNNKNNLSTNEVKKSFVDHSVDKHRPQKSLYTQEQSFTKPQSYKSVLENKLQKFLNRKEDEVEVVRQLNVKPQEKMTTLFHVPVEPQPTKHEPNKWEKVTPKQKRSIQISPKHTPKRSEIESIKALNLTENFTSLQDRREETQKSKSRADNFAAEPLEEIKNEVGKVKETQPQESVKEESKLDNEENKQKKQIYIPKLKYNLESQYFSSKTHKTPKKMSEPSSKATVNKSLENQEKMESRQNSPRVQAKVENLMQKNATLKVLEERIMVDPKEVSLKVNLSTANTELNVLKKIFEKNGWSKVGGQEGDILWTSKLITQQVGQQFHDLRINRLPAMKELSCKKSTAIYIQKSQEYFPEIYDFSPRTFVMPEEFNELYYAFKANKNKLYIAKPDKGTQGTGIFILQDLEQLFDETSVDMQSIKKGLVVQEYVANPLLVDKKKFDLRIYALITSLHPLIVYINEEGLARFCTEEYQAPNQQNINNAYMHLTNYTLNKASEKFIHQPENFLEVNSASKRTFSSLLKSLESMGIDCNKINKEIEGVISKFVYSMHPYLLQNFREVFQDKWESARCFHILGFDILFDQNLKPWILEVNANPSLDISQECIDELGHKWNELSLLDYHVKSKVIEDAMMIMMKEPARQIEEIRKNRFFNSYKMVLDGEAPIPNIDLVRRVVRYFQFEKLIMIFGQLSGHKFGNLNCSKFARLSHLSKLTNDQMLKSDYDLIFKKVMMKQKSNEMTFVQFIDAMEKVAQKFLAKKNHAYSKLDGLIWVANKIAEQVS